MCIRDRDKEAYSSFEDKEKEELDQLRRITVDFVQPGEQQPEIEHNFKAQHSYSGYLNIVQRGWRDCRGEGFFSYEMSVDPQVQMYLVVTYFGGDRTFYIDGIRYERDFQISVDGHVIAEQKLEANQPYEDTFEVRYELPLSLTTGKTKIEIMFLAAEGKVAGGVYGVRITNSKECF